MQHTASFNLQNPDRWFDQCLRWANQYKHLVALNGSNSSFPGGSFPIVVACSNQQVIQQDPFTIPNDEQWLFGYWAYDSKNAIESLQSNNPTLSGFSDFGFFHPETLFRIKGNSVMITSNDSPEAVYQQISQQESSGSTSMKVGEIKCLTDKEIYCRNVERIREQILSGDFYEINYCIAPYAENTVLDPIDTFTSILRSTISPFSCFVKQDDQYLISGSPERFLKKEGLKVISQPIKGTIRRGKSADEDLQLQQMLRTSEKEIAENMMIVDLVRNDLARSCKTGSVTVDEFFGIYQFPYWHQMISTVSGEVRKNITNTEIIRNAFPMGSMTGAPKIKAMNMIEDYENFKRGIYSGTVGYIDPEGDFDFNVVIRSIIYDSSKQMISMPVGSAITYDSNAEAEWDECWLKAKSMLKVLEDGSM